MRVRGWRGPMAGSPRRAWMWVRISPMWVWITMGEALLICRGLVVSLILIVALVEWPITLQAVPWGRPTPSTSVGGPGWAMKGWLMPWRARGAVPGRRAPMVWRSLSWRRSMVVASIMVWWGEVSRGGRAQTAWPWGAIAWLADSRGVGDMWTRNSRGLGQLAATSTWSAGPRGGGDWASADRTTALKQNVNKENQNAPQQQQTSIEQRDGKQTDIERERRYKHHRKSFKSMVMVQNIDIKKPHVTLKVNGQRETVIKKKSIKQKREIEIHK